MAKQQLAAVINKYNDDDPSASLKIIQKDVPSDLKDGEVLVRMMLRPINPSDMFCMRGRYGGFKPKSLPAVPGLEGRSQVRHVEPARCWCLHIAYAYCTPRLASTLIGVCYGIPFLSGCKMVNAFLQGLELLPS